MPLYMYLSATRKLQSGVGVPIGDKNPVTCKAAGKVCLACLASLAEDVATLARSVNTLDRSGPRDRAAWAEAEVCERRALHGARVGSRPQAHSCGGGERDGTGTRAHLQGHAAGGSSTSAWFGFVEFR
ncbi:hypothetical protein J6590_004782 [Homalodisca vitripennis]|nr:hypothetical protein J6590_004782 [Homalodisca vitripennis]